MGMNVLSLFDGMSCGKLALDKAGISVDNYFASEIDESAIKVSLDNFPDIVHLGDVSQIQAAKLPKIDLLIGGSPCQGFSMAGKKLNFNDPRSKLFFEFVRLKNELQPKYFLLENVRMKKSFEQIISNELGVEPIMINSALLTAHDRKRLYWTNIPNVKQPLDKGFQLKDILCKATDDLFIKDEIAQRYNHSQKYKQNHKKSCVLGKLSKYQGDRVFDIECKASSLSASGGNNGGGSCNIIFDPLTNKLRRLSVTECEHLQGVPDGYTKAASQSQRYKMLGNGWTVDVIAHIFQGLKDDS